MAEAAEESSSSGTSSNALPPPPSKFEQKLQYNVDRFVKILLDEQQEHEERGGGGGEGDKEHQQQASSSSSSSRRPLVEWLEQNYGIEKTKQLKASSWDQFSNTTSSPTTKDQLDVLKQFLEWFRIQFPYYRDECEHCQAKGCTLKGNEHPTDEEKQGSSLWIDTTEVSYCSKCQKESRFPRYLSSMEITRRKKGRCSEYSLLLYRILRSLGHNNRVRWIVDYANHVWTEIWLSTGNDENSDEGGGRWIHLDPCEAAVDTPYMYQGWGKQQTYIVAFESSSTSKSSSSGLRLRRSVMDVTKEYTKDPFEMIVARRIKDGTTQDDIDSSIERANKDLQSLSLLELVDKHKKAIHDTQ